MSAAERSGASYLVTHYAAPNDRNGNPRRVFVVRRMSRGSDYAEVVAVLDEGYAGSNFVHTIRPRLPAAWANVTFDPVRVNIPPREYLRLRRIGAALGAEGRR